MWCRAVVGGVRSRTDSVCSGRVMSFIEKSVARLDQPERLQALALELGKSHYRYNAPPKYYGVKITSKSNKMITDPHRRLLRFSVQFVSFFRLEFF